MDFSILQSTIDSIGKLIDNENKIKNIGLNDENKIINQSEIPIKLLPLSDNEIEMKEKENQIDQYEFSDQNLDQFENKKNEMDNMDIKRSRPRENEKEKEKWTFDPAIINHTVNELKYLADILLENSNIYELETRLIKKNEYHKKIDTNIDIDIWQSCFYYFFILNNNGLKKEKYSTRDSYYTGFYRFRETLKEGGQLSTQWIIKPKGINHDKRICNRPLSFRMSLKKEIPLTETPGSVNKHSKPYRIQAKNVYTISDGFLTIFFTENWIADSAEKLINSIVTRSIEVEFNNQCIQKNKTTSEEIISNLLYRTLELQGLATPLALTDF